MQLAFATKELRRICTEADFAERQLGDDLAAALIDRLADIRAADSLVELLDYELSIVDKQLRVRIELTNEASMELSENHLGLAWSVSSEVVLSSVWRLLLHKIEVRP